MRSLLFAPAVRPQRFVRALESGADAVCLDLEDAVPPADKDTARAAAVEFLASQPRGPLVGVRINALDSDWWRDDLAALGALAAFILIPKVSAAAQVGEARAGAAPPCGLWPMIETAEGLMRSWEIAAAGAEGLVFGAFDYVADVGCEMEWEPLLFARSQLAAACGRAKIGLLDSPSGDLSDLAALQASTQRAKGLGFTGRACIHPNQVGVVNAVYTPSPDEVVRARHILEAFESAGGGAAQLDGKLIELPVALAARRILARAPR